MSDEGAPSQFVDQAQNEENYDNLLDLELFGDDNFGVDVDGEQGFDVPDESINQQDVDSPGTPVTREQQQEVPSNGGVQPTQPLLNDEDFLGGQDFVQDPENGATNQEALGGAPSQTVLPDLEHLSQPEQRDVSSLAPTVVQHASSRNSQQEPNRPNESHDYQQEADDLAQGQPGLTALQNIDLKQYLSNVDRSQGGLMSRDDQAHPQVIELGAADPLGIGLPTNGLINLEQNPGFNLDFFDAEMWQNVGNAGYDVDIDEILGAGVPERQQSHPEPSSAHRAPNATTTAVRHLPAEYHADSDDDYPNDSDEDSEGSSVSDNPPFETYGQNDPLIVADPPREHWGQTGRRNGQEVWFNPEIRAWRKFYSSHFTRAVSPNSMQNHQHLIMI